MFKERKRGQSGPKKSGTNTQPERQYRPNGEPYRGHAEDLSLHIAREEEKHKNGPGMMQVFFEKNNLTAVQHMSSTKLLVASTLDFFKGNTILLRITLDSSLTLSFPRTCHAQCIWNPTTLPSVMATLLALSLSHLQPGLLALPPDCLLPGHTLALYISSAPAQLPQLFL